MENNLENFINNQEFAFKCISNIVDENININDL